MFTAQGSKPNKSKPSSPSKAKDDRQKTQPKSQTQSGSKAASSQKPAKGSATSVSMATPKTAPKLDKATPYEFISAWNALKKSESVKPYYDLLKQVKPGDIKTGRFVL